MSVSPRRGAQPSAVRTAAETTNPLCQIHMRTLWDPHVILMKGSAQMGYGFFFFLLWRIPECLVFVQRIFRNGDENLLSGDRRGDQRYVHFILALSNTDAPSLWGSLRVFFFFFFLSLRLSKNCVKSSNRVANSDSRVMSACPNSQARHTGRRLCFSSSDPRRWLTAKLLTSCNIFSSRPKTVKRMF